MSSHFCRGDSSPGCSIPWLFCGKVLALSVPAGAGGWGAGCLPQFFTLLCPLLPLQQVHLIVGQALKRYSEDRVGMVDYALESAGRWWRRASCPGEVTTGCWRAAHLLPSPLMPGASVINTRCSETYETRTALLSLFGIPLWYHSQSPRVILQVGSEGEDWAASHLGFSGLWLLLSSQADGRKMTLMVVTLLVSHFHAHSQTSTLGTAGHFVAPRALLSSASPASSAPRP